MLDEADALLINLIYGGNYHDDLLLSEQWAGLLIPSVLCTIFCTAFPVKTLVMLRVHVV